MDGSLLPVRGRREQRNRESPHPGCFNPDLHDPEGGRNTDTEQVVDSVISSGVRIEGASISGGEPFQRPDALLVFSGYTLEGVKQLPLGPAILQQVDALIAGACVQAQSLGRRLMGSFNQ